MKRSTLVILIGLVLVGMALAIAIAVSVLHDGLSAKATPTRLEAFVARNARHLAIPGNARLMENPVLDSPEIQREARLHFADHCAICRTRARSRAGRSAPSEAGRSGGPIGRRCLPRRGSRRRHA